jgi:hypothetical protein
MKTKIIFNPRMKDFCILKFEICLPALPTAGRDFEFCKPYGLQLIYFLL